MRILTHSPSVRVNKVDARYLVFAFQIPFAFSCRCGWGAAQICYRSVTGSVIKIASPPDAILFSGVQYCILVSNRPAVPYKRGTLTLCRLAVVSGEMVVLSLLLINYAGP